MDVGLNINEGMRIRIGDSFKSIIDTLDKCGIEYRIPYQGKEATGQKSEEQTIVLFLEKFGVELNIMGDKVVYIKSNNSNSNALFKVGDTDNPIEILRSIMLQICSLFEVGQSAMALEKYDSKTYSTVLKLKVDNRTYIKISVIRNANNIAHINTVRLIVK